MSENQNQGPLQTLRDGAVFAKLWQQEGKNGPFVSVEVGRTYQDQQSGEYGVSRSFSGSDVLKVQAIMLEAHREVGKWHEFFKDQQRTQDRQSELPMQPDTARSEPQPQNQHPQGLAAQRDQALAHAKAPERSTAPTPGRTPEV
ncbi:hypothetical protein [Thalassobaculum litoreum]|uniref:Uncharacterized protein n=1 Tax=Thalassobaculum litoreum DSM 18839 TaxID=1123362 RepID=A0A8G2F5J8_9PROT|nr:hypothetical protein [Thalassobaculum litoreum]SDG50889.1 hypothetical protein SAMN05660686_04665 [Thalassobaculum litoreum DSM 18839]